MGGRAEKKQKNSNQSRRRMGISHFSHCSTINLHCFILTPANINVEELWSSILGCNPVSENSYSWYPGSFSWIGTVWRTLQLNQLAAEPTYSPSSLWAAGAGRRTTNHSLSFLSSLHPFLSPPSAALSRVQPSWQRSQQSIVTLHSDLYFLQSGPTANTHGETHTHTAHWWFRFRHLLVVLSLAKYLALMNWNIAWQKLCLNCTNAICASCFLKTSYCLVFQPWRHLSVCLDVHVQYLSVCVYILYAFNARQSVCGCLLCKWWPLCEPLCSMKSIFLCRVWGSITGNKSLLSR